MSITTTSPTFDQPALTTTGGMVTANHYLAAEAGARMLARGGNAVDAAVATAFAAGVVEPAMSGLGGRGYMVIHLDVSGASAVIDGHERAPRAAGADMFEVEQRRQIPTQGWGPQVPVAGEANITGHLAVAVPGVVGALAVAQRRYGQLALAEVLEPAITLAEEGFEIGVPLAVTITRQRAKLARFPATAVIFLRDGFPPTPEDRLVQTDLAGSLRRIAEQGPEAFYEGEIAAAIVAEMERAGGLITRADISEFEPRVWDRPLTGRYRGHQILTVPEAAGGVTLLQILNLLEGYDLAALDPEGAPFLHLLLEASRIAFRDRLAVIEDPAFAPVPYDGLVSKAFAEERRRFIRLERALESVEPGDPWPYNGRLPDTVDSAQPQASTVSWRPSDRDTTHFCAVDRAGTVVSMTQSIIDAFGSGVVVPGTGILLNSAMHNFNPIPGQLGSIAPWKRSVHNGAPAIVLNDDGTPRLAIGGAGGTKIITGVVRAIIGLLDHGRSLQQAIAAPRAHNEGWESQIDGRVPATVIETLCGMGHRLEVQNPSYARPAFSRINGIAIDAGGHLSSGVDIFTDAGAAALTAL